MPGKGVHGRVFWPAAGTVLAFVVVTVASPAAVESAVSGVSSWIVGTFGWYYTLLVSAFVVFAVWLGVGRFGGIRLGDDGDEPEFSRWSWFAMLFAAGMGIGLVFWGVAEPLNHFAGIPNRASGIAAADEAGAQSALVQTFLHWGLHPWAIYVVVGLAIAYAVHRKKRPVSIRWALEPLLGRRVNGWIGDAVDVVAVVGTLFGVATSLGLGVAQIAAGLDFIGVVRDPGNLTKVVLIGAITLIAITSVVTGVKRGIKWLSNANMGLAAALLVFVLVTGPTLFILREFIQSCGLYVQNFVRMSFNTTAYQGAEGQAWQGYWTAFYWGWWMSWAPFVGVFIARISRGRTVREFVAGVLLVPTLLSFFWFSVFGGAGLFKQLFGGGDLVGTDATGASTVDTNGALFGLLGSLPGGAVVVGFAIVLVVLFFVTSSDSGSLVVDMLASGGNVEPPTWSRVFWGVTEGVVAIALLFAGGLGALQGVSIAIALPFSVVMIAMCVAIHRQFTREHASAVRAEHRFQRTEPARTPVAEGNPEATGDQPVTPRP
ncbi:BCCT family transporter [Actinokineospora sp. PR83]|uniref:BCCT family transporter n=1 Tax=Actinokineospora sp. PR83 TaxID=2884908 RepID=UPI0027E12DBA|nr:BCCT family transporter [Actinokineospora sp. PR83]MCG8917718.1 BCCT family transporter [Actinokineospora sp. PR83]